MPTNKNPHSGHETTLIATGAHYRVLRRDYFHRGVKQPIEDSLFIIQTIKGKPVRTVWGDESRALRVAGISQ